jgi:hypothetical protein
VKNILKLFRRRTFRVFRYDNVRITLFRLGRVGDMINSILDIYNLDRIDLATISKDRASFILVSKDPEIIQNKEVICLVVNGPDLENFSNDVPLNVLKKHYPEIQSLLTKLRVKIIEDSKND